MGYKVIVKSDKIFDNKSSTEELVSILLANRGIMPSDLSEFITPQNPDTLPLSSFGIDPDLVDIACDLIKNTISQHENIFIYGDYDVDGVTSTALLHQTLLKMGASVFSFVPDREKDGYGFRYQSFCDAIRKQGTKISLLITVDNGIVAHQELHRVKEDGIKIIVSDHHLPSDTPPPADVVVYSPLVSGCGISWLIAKSLDKSADIGLAALGTVADCLPLTFPNRNIVVHGLMSLRLSPSLGLKKLIEISNVRQDSLTTYDLGYILGPRINAVGRLSSPMTALKLLISNSPQEIASLASSLDGFNKDRQYLQSDNIEIAERSVDVKGNRLVFASDANFHPGIIGLVAGRLTEKYHLPSIVISSNGELAKGSCRSIPELNIIEALRQASDLLVELGGHAGAAGFSIKNQNISDFKNKISSIINKHLESVDLSPKIAVDAVMKLSFANLKTFKAISKLSPFGIGNPEPLFLFKGLKIVQKRQLGSNLDHLKLKLDDPATRFPENYPADAIAFKKGSLEPTLKIGQLVDIVASVDSNTWQGVTTPQLRVKEIIPIETDLIDNQNIQSKISL